SFFSEERLQSGSQKLLASLLRLFRFGLRFLRLTVVRVEGDRSMLAHRGQIVVANHPSLIDALIILSFCPSLRCVAKAGLARVPPMGFLISRLGHVVNDGSSNVPERCAELLRAGRSILFFPEGTRSKGLSIGPFLRGAATAAVRADAQVLPIVIKTNVPTLQKG